MLRLAARGLTTAQIADELVISPKTADHHIQHIYNKIGVSTRALGSLKINSKGINEVQKDFYLATAGDIVADPSAPDAFVQGVMEGAEWIINEETGLWTAQTIDETRDLIEKAKKAELEEVKIRVFKAFLARL